ncbi:Copper transporter 1B [Carabus blaptoides fortunei]
MHMSFWWDFKINNFLFWGYDITTLVVFTLTCCGLLLFGFAFEWIKILQAKVRHSGFHMAHSRRLCPGESDALLTNNQESSTSSAQQQVTTLPLSNKRNRLIYFTTDFILWQVQQILGYLLMLIVMVYNGYMMIAIVLGYGLGYFVFYPLIMRINIENYKIMQSASLCRPECEQESSALLSSNTVETTIAPCHASTSTTNTVISEVI